MISANSLEKKRPAQRMTEEEYQQHKHQAKAKYKRTAFKSDEVSVVFVLGGPGAGKGTQCANIVRDFGFKHLSAGDLLRDEQQNPNSKYGELIANYIREGKIVPQEITIALLQNAMQKTIESENKHKFLIDGFPRKMDQAIKFEQDVAISKFTLFFDCPETVMLKRLLKRGETSGRTDDNVESIKKRFRTFDETSMPVVKYFEMADKVVKVSCDQPVDKVYAQVKRALQDRGLS
jgi:UMP-CMP kinase